MSVSQDLGKAGITYYGAHDPTVAYEKNTIVGSNGDSYISKQSVPIGTAISNTTYWGLLCNGFSEAEITTAVNAWLVAHPEATTTVQDGAVTTAKLADGAVTDEKLASGGVLSVVDNITYLYESPNLFNVDDSSMWEADKSITATGATQTSVGLHLLKVPITDLTASYNLYLVNSQGTVWPPAQTRIAMYDKDGNNLGILVNNTNSAATPNNPNCKYLYCYVADAKFSTAMFCKTTGVNIEGFIPYLKERRIKTQWTNKTLSFYGDSIVADTSGNFAYKGWARYVSAHYGIDKFYGRGIGSQKFTWTEGGGSVSFINADGTLNSRNDSYTKDNYTGTVPEGTTATRGCFCSWDRITHMYPASIKDTIDMVFIMGGTNDFNNDTALDWVANDTTDPEWAASTYYATYGGDYNITTLRGGVASTIMKFQAWMPNAIIIIGSPLNGRTNASGTIKPEAVVPEEYAKTQNILAVANMFGCYGIDVFGTCGINLDNSSAYITDGVHPYSVDGRKMLARTVIGGMNSIFPHIV